MSKINATVKITLEGLEAPQVWRELSIPLNITFEQLHQIIQAAFGWEDSHLYAFCERNLRDLITINCPIDEDAVVKANEVVISNLMINLFNRKIYTKDSVPFKYIYDYGDSWTHQIDVLTIEYDSAEYITLKNGNGACPPEDIGGVPIYEAIKNGEIEIGLPPGFDPDYFDQSLAKARLRELERIIIASYRQ